MNIYSVYHIHVKSSLDNGYIGITKNAELRFSQHTWKRKKTNCHLRNAFAKYGDAIKFSVLVKNLDFEAASLIEEMLRPKPNMGWNIAIGGSLPPNPKGKERSKEYKENISKAKMGDKNPMFGKALVFTDKHKSRLSASAKNMPLLQCPHCGKEGRCNVMKRWHFDGCKNANK
jgi:predicted GIY-YIG superfamily endonuclease